MTSATLRELVRETHPHRLMEPLDTTALNDLSLASPTVIIEVVGAREGLDALIRVRRVAPDAPVAAVRVAAMDRGPDRRQGRLGRRIAMICLGVLAATAITASVLRIGADGSAARTATIVAAAAAAPVVASLAVASARTMRRARRTPMQRRRHFERRRSITVIAVRSIDGSSATRLASTVRRELDSVHAGDALIDVSVFDPPECRHSHN